MKIGIAKRKFNAKLLDDYGMIEIMGNEYKPAEILIKFKDYDSLLNEYIENEDLEIED